MLFIVKSNQISQREYRISKVYYEVKYHFCCRDKIRFFESLQEKKNRDDEATQAAKSVLRLITKGTSMPRKWTLGLFDRYDDAVKFKNRSLNSTKLIFIGWNYCTGVPSKESVQFVNSKRDTKIELEIIYSLSSDFGCKLMIVGFLFGYYHFEKKSGHFNKSDLLPTLVAIFCVTTLIFIIDCFVMAENRCR